MKTKVVYHHNVSCGALEQARKGKWPSPWYVTDETREEFGKYKWIVLRCQDPYCDGEAWALVDPQDVPHGEARIPDPT